MTDLDDELLKAQLWLERMKPDTLDALYESLISARNKIVARIESTKSITEKKRLNIIKAIIENEMDAAYSGIYEDMRKEYNEYAKISYEATNAIMAGYAPEMALAWAALPKSAIERILDPNRPILGETLKEIPINLNQAQQRRIKKAVANALYSGAGIDEAQRTARIVGEVENLFGKITRHEIDTVVRTAMMAAVHEGRNANFEEYAKAGFIVGWRSLGTLDSRTSDICRELDQKFYPIKGYKSIDDVPYKPPRHPNCRSILTAETELSMKIDGERPYAIHDKRTVNHRDGTRSTKFKVADKGYVSGKTDFNSFFERQSASFQKEYLGPKRYELYKSGKIKLSDVYDIARKKRLTLKELQAKIGE